MKTEDYKELTIREAIKFIRQKNEGDALKKSRYYEIFLNYKFVKLFPNNGKIERIRRISPDRIKREITILNFMIENDLTDEEHFMIGKKIIEGAGLDKNKIYLLSHVNSRFSLVRLGVIKNKCCTINGGYYIPDLEKARDWINFFEKFS